MKAWKEYALCDANGFIKTINVYQIGQAGEDYSNLAAKELYGKQAFSFDVTQYLADIGDQVIGTELYRGTKKVEYIPTDEEQLSELNTIVNTILIDILKEK